MHISIGSKRINVLIPNIIIIRYVIMSCKKNITPKHNRLGSNLYIN